MTNEQLALLSAFEREVLLSFQEVKQELALIRSQYHVLRMAVAEVVQERKESGL